MRNDQTPLPHRHQKPTHTSLIRALATSLALLASLIAHQTYAEDRFPDREKFSLSVGNFHVTKMSTDLTVGKAAGAAGVSVSFERTLNLPDGVDVQRLDGYYRFNRKHRLDFSYWNIGRTGNITLPVPINIGGVIFDGDVASTGSSQIIKALWSYSFINDTDYEFWLGAGVYINSVKSTITDVSTPANTVSLDSTAPLPIFSFRGAWHITKKFKFEAKQDLFFLEYGGLSGTLSDFSLAIEHRTFKHIGFGGSLNHFNTNAQVTVEGTDSEMNRRYNGAMVYMKGVF